MRGSFTAHLDATRQRLESRFGGGHREVVVSNGSEVWVHTSFTGTEELEGARKEKALLDHPTVRYGNWAEHYERVEVLKRLRNQDDTESVLLVRVVPREGFNSTIFVDEKSGLIRHIDSLEQIPGMGVIGLRTHFEDYREVGGMMLPYKSTAKFANKLIGLISFTVKKIQTGVELSDELFAP